jgi:hypothetical protein
MEDVVSGGSPVAPLGGDDILQPSWPKGAAFHSAGWQYNFALGGSITLHWVAELIAFSTRTALDRREDAYGSIRTLSLKGQSQKPVSAYDQHHDRPHPG